MTPSLARKSAPFRVEDRRVVCRRAEACGEVGDVQHPELVVAAAGEDGDEQDE